MRIFSIGVLVIGASLTLGDVAHSGPVWDIFTPICRINGLLLGAALAGERITCEVSGRRAAGDPEETFAQGVDYRLEVVGVSTEVKAEFSLEDAGLYRIFAVGLEAALGSALNKDSRTA
jgi:hypothetical protein